MNRGRPVSNVGIGVPSNVGISVPDTDHKTESWYDAGRGTTPLSSPRHMVPKRSPNYKALTVPRGQPLTLPGRNPRSFDNRGSKGKTTGRKRGSKKNRKQDIFDYGREAYNLVKKVISEINVELKCFDVVFSGNGTAASGGIANLSNIAQGDDYNQRTGDSILLQAIQWRVAVEVGGSPQPLVRLIVFADNDNRGTDPAVTDVLQTASPTSPLAFYVDLARAKRYTILDDKTFVVATNWQQKQWHLCERQLHRHVYYASTAAADASNYKGAVFLLYITDAGSLAPTFTGTCRLYYTDN